MQARSAGLSSLEVAGTTVVEYTGIFKSQE